tara:strand:- start:4503 stop:5144 length:642 start_codon:yes stop_codon:yes gene_type:complete
MAKRRKARTTMLLQSQIEQAMKVTRSNKAAAEYLRVSYPLYRKFAKQYKNEDGISLFQLHYNQSGSGISKIGSSTKRSKLDDILLGKHPNYPREKLLARLVVNGYFPEECSNCGFCQKRPTDLKVPLTLNTINGDRKDLRIDNLEILCYNCYFVNVGNLGKVELKVDINEAPEKVPVEDVFEDPEKLDALSSMELLTEEEKIKIMNDLKNSIL